MSRLEHAAHRAVTHAEQAGRSGTGLLAASLAYQAADEFNPMLLEMLL